MQLTYKISLMLIAILFYSCSEEDRNSSIITEDIHGIINKANDYLDSASSIYRPALNDLQLGVSKDSVLKVYEYLAREMYQKTNSCIDSVSTLYREGEITEKN